MLLCKKCHCRSYTALMSGTMTSNQVLNNLLSSLLPPFFFFLSFVIYIISLFRMKLKILMNLCKNPFPLINLFHLIFVSSIFLLHNFYMLLKTVYVLYTMYLQIICTIHIAKFKNLSNILINTSSNLENINPLLLMHKKVIIDINNIQMNNVTIFMQII